MGSRPDRRRRATKAIGSFRRGQGGHNRSRGCDWARAGSCRRWHPRLRGMSSHHCDRSGEPRKQLVASAEVKAGITVVEVAIGQEQGVAAAGIRAFEVCRVITATCKCRCEEHIELLL